MSWALLSPVRSTSTTRTHGERHASDASAAETVAIAPANTGRFKISRSTGTTTSPLAVSYSMSGTAANGTDYQSPSGMAIIPSGSTYTYVYVTPLDDAVAEGSETVNMTLKTDTSYKLGTTSAVVNLMDNE